MTEIDNTVYKSYVIPYFYMWDISYFYMWDSPYYTDLWILNMQTGIHGQVFSSDGKPLPASIAIQGINYTVWAHIISFICYLQYVIRINICCTSLLLENESESICVCLYISNKQGNKKHKVDKLLHKWRPLPKLLLTQSTPSLPLFLP